jgi:hypothetical protein
VLNVSSFSLPRGQKYPVEYLFLPLSYTLSRVSCPFQPFTPPPLCSSAPSRRSTHLAALCRHFILQPAHLLPQVKGVLRILHLCVFAPGTKSLAAMLKVDGRGARDRLCRAGRRWRLRHMMLVLLGALFLP